MKTIFYSFILLFATAYSWAQVSVNYVSFFPPAQVVHSAVSLTQNNDSFDYSLADPYTVYTNQQGGLILGANDNAITNIPKITILNESDDPAYTIEDFNVDNIIKVSSSGTVNNIDIGREYTSGNVLPWEDIFISANSIYFPALTNYEGVEHDVRSSNLTSSNQVWQDNNFLPRLNSKNENISWVYLRIPGTEECRRYLVKYNGTAPSDNCNMP